MTIVAEGVETEAQKNALADLDCDYLQGYLISKPLPVYEFGFFIRNLNQGCAGQLPVASA
ncbi:MAG: EAL domain-containing protein, partial [Oceanospirillum sp.]|nr:EAL domain-containing protein [Oceanospirillum sp.]